MIAAEGMEPLGDLFEPGHFPAGRTTILTLHLGGRRRWLLSDSRVGYERRQRAQGNSDTRRRDYMRAPFPATAPHAKHSLIRMNRGLHE